MKVSEDKKTTSEAYPFGEHAHIVAEEEAGPRGKSALTAVQRISYHNHILLCPTCHTKIDKAPDDFPLELLHQFKSEHELWFEKNRVSAVDKLRQAQDYIYAEIVDAAARLCMFDQWEIWTGWANSVSPSWQRDWIESIEEFRRRIIRTVWPGTLPELERALKVLSINLAMASKSFQEHCEPTEEGWLREVRFYRGAGFNKNYDQDLAEYTNWIKEQDRCIFESTKGANWVAEVVRRELNPSFFAVPGKFVITTGPDMSGAFTTRVVEYSRKEKEAEPRAALARLQADHNAKRQIEKKLWGGD